MPRPPRHQRPQHHFKPGRVDPWDDRATTAAAVAERVRYHGSGKHKSHPAPNGEWTPIWRPGTAKCQQFAQSGWLQVVEALREAIRHSCVQWEPEREFPTRAWAYINGKLHEARITNPQTGEYHGFPLDYESQKPDDPNNLLMNAPRVDIPVI